jgi:hypothetical protein
MVSASLALPPPLLGRQPPTAYPTPNEPAHSPAQAEQHLGFRIGHTMALNPRSTRHPDSSDVTTAPVRSNPEPEPVARRQPPATRTPAFTTQAFV